MSQGRDNSAGLMATLRTADMNLPQLAGLASIREGLQAMIHDITALLSLPRRKLTASP